MKGPSPTAGADIEIPPDTRIIEDRVPARATLDSLLRLQIGEPVAPLIVGAVRTAFDPRRLRAGQPYRIVLRADGRFRSFEYTIDADRFLRVSEPDRGDSSTLAVEIVEHPKKIVTAAIHGAVDSGHPSLVAVIDEAGERVDLALQLAEIFSGQLDFNTDLQLSDEFEALFEKEYRNGQFARYGTVIAATIVNGGRRLRAFRFAAGDGRPGYYDENGNSVRRLLLKSPLPFDPRITSRFSLRRMHPVYGVRTSHLGVDYAAAIDTPVMAVADGVVVSAGSNGASGRMIQLRHAQGYHTYYLHLSRIGNGIHPGARVSQGDIIGLTGNSGVTTGPHLDYRISRNGVFLDPIRVHRSLPPGEPLPEDMLAAFAATRDIALHELSGRPVPPEAFIAGAEPPPGLPGGQ
jgi:murein DD-endopeptidase MepM/ murein hydrolase activator NlpD